MGHLGKALPSNPDAIVHQESHQGSGVETQGHLGVDVFAKLEHRAPVLGLLPSNPSASDDPCPRTLMPFLPLGWRGVGVGRG